MIKINDLQIKNNDFVVTPAGFTLKHYANVFTNASTYLPMLRSSVYSVLAAAGSVLFMMIVAITVINHKKNKFIQTLEFGFYIALLLPSLLLALSSILAYSVCRTFCYLGM